MSANPASWIAGWSRRAPDRLALAFDGVSYSYSALQHAVERVAGGLAALGVRPGDRVAFLGLNSPDYVALVFACAHVGAILAPLNWRLAPAEIDQLLADAEPRVLVHDPEFAGTATGFAGVRLVCAADPARISFAELPAAPTPARVEDPAATLLLIYTSGTTGRAKGAMLSHANLLWNAINCAHAHDLVADDKVLTNLPMFHAGGLNLQSLPALHAGAALIVQRRFTPEGTFAAIAGERPTLYLSVPSALQQLVEQPAFADVDFSSLRLIMTGSAPVPEPLIRTFLARGVPLGQIYGCTEATGAVVYTRREEVMDAVGFAGRPAIHAEVQIVDLAGHEVARGEPGEVAVRGPTVFQGYWRQPAASAECRQGEWLLTGDIGRFDARGLLRIEDRRKDMIISGGYNIYPAELEAILAERADLAEAAVVGRPDAKWGEVPIVFAVARSGHPAAPEAVAQFLAGRVARYKQPAEIRFLDALPRNATGKVLKFRLRELAATTPA